MRPTPAPDAEKAAAKAKKEKEERERRSRLEREQREAELRRAGRRAAQEEDAAFQQVWNAWKCDGCGWWQVLLPAPWRGFPKLSGTGMG